MTILAVAVFGAVGALMRWLAEYAVRLRHPVQRPWATVGANVVGCAVAGLVMAQIATTSAWHSILLTGFCGGLTTFSSAFAIPVIIAREHHIKYAVALILVTFIGCSIAFAIGVSLG
jgi:fluoride exporter